VIGDVDPKNDVAEALMRMAGGYGRLLWHKSKQWASASLEGTRDEVAFEYLGPDASAAGEQLLVDLNDANFALPGRTVTDTQIGYHTRLNRPQPRTVAVLELLIVKD
jgi:hypothetical protein